MQTKQSELEQKIIKRLCNEEVIIFIANRHMIEPVTLITGFMAEASHVPSILLENEREILRALMNETTQNYEKI